MSFNVDDVKKIARLSRIRIEDDKIQEYTGDIGKILNFVEQLSDVDTDSVEPMTGAMDMTQRLRDDVVTDGNYPERVTQNAPDTTMNFFTVPKVVE